MNINPDIEAHDLLQQLAFHHVYQCISLLDVGFGGGDLLRKMANHYQCPAWGVDPFAYDHSDGDIHFRALLAENIDQLNHRFDLIYSVHSFHHFNSPQKFLSALGKVLRGSGVFILVDWKYGADTGINEHYYKSDEVNEWLTAFNFQLIDQGVTDENMYFAATLKTRKIAVPPING